MALWIPELCESLPMEFVKLDDGNYIQRKDIRECEYHSLDGYQTFAGYECYSRIITPLEYEELTKKN